MNEIDPEKFRGIEKELCPECQDMLVRTLKPVQDDLQSSSKFLRAKAKIKLAKLQISLWKKYCPNCINMLKRKIKE